MECDKCSSDTRAEEGLLICSNCGMIQGVEYRSEEKRTFSSEEYEKVKRTERTSQGYHDKNLGSEVPWDFSDLSQKQRQRAYRLRKWNKRCKIANSSRERSISQNLSLTHLFASRLQVPQTVKEEAFRISRKVSEEKMSKGRTREEVIAAALYLASRICDFPLTFVELAQSCGVDKKKTSVCYRKLTRELDVNPRPPTPFDLVKKHRHDLELNGSFKKIREVLEEIPTSGRGRSPNTLAAAAVSYVNSDIMKKTIADLFNTTVKTITKLEKNYIEEHTEN